MTRPDDAERTFAAADPVADLDLTGPLEAVWERIEALPDPRRALVGRDRRTLRILTAAAAATVIAIAMALLPATDRRDGSAGIPAPVQAFADELTGEGVLHVITKRTSAIDELGRVTPLPRLRTEGWYALDGSAWRTRMNGVGPGYAEHVFDGRSISVFDSDCGLVQSLARPATPVLASLLDLDSELTAGHARVLGPTIVAGVPAYDIGYDRVPGDAYPFDWHLYVSADRARLLRIEALVVPPAPESQRIRERSEVPTYEILPPTVRTAELLLPAREFRGISRSTCA